MKSTFMLDWPILFRIFSEDTTGRILFKNGP